VTDISPTWEYGAVINLMKLQWLQNKVIRTTGKFTMNAPIRYMHTAFQITYAHDYKPNYAGTEYKQKKNKLRGP
jgi:hypothetical protein